MVSQEVDISIRHVIKEFVAKNGETLRAVDDVSMDIYRGEFFAMLGPSGCGKTTTLRMIAGFEDPSSGEILLRGKPMQNVPPFHRPVNTVFQDYALFPHMSVLQNVMFGLEMEGVRKPEAMKRAHEALELVKLKGVDRKPRQLSGGQQQRVALARALVKRPAVLLLDEPLGALDLKLRKDMQYELMSMQKQLGITFIYVTHDQEEALTMADRIAVMNQGHVLQLGTPEEIYESPTTRFVADFIGETNFLTGKLVSVEGAFGNVQLDDKTIVKACLNAISNTSVGSDVTVAVRPEKLNIFPSSGNIKNPDGTSDDVNVYKSNVQRDLDMNLVLGTIKLTNYIGTDTRYIVEFGEGQKVVARVQNFGLRSDSVFEVGEQVYIFWDADYSNILLQ